MTSRDEFVEGLKQKIDTWNAEIGKLETEMRKASDDAQKRYAEQIAEAEKFRDQAKAKMEEIRQSSSADWERMRGDMEKAWKDIEQGFRAAWSRFR